jgi:1-acyl-sn-glycerol-3-phosphate acyltransferase
MLGIFTDGGGGNRYRVRESLVKLAVRSGRPVVPFRSLYSPGFRLFGEDYPRGFSVKGCSVFGKPISAEELSRMEPEAARTFLEKSLLELSSERLT